MLTRNKLTNVPYPKPSFRAFLKVLAGVAASITFILLVFQPFGTANFEHPYKWLLLSGYGLVTLVAGLATYAAWVWIADEKYLDRWSILDELMFVFSTALLSVVGCYLYWAFSFGEGLYVSSFLNFLVVATCVACLPLSAYLLYLYYSYRHIHFAEVVPDPATPVAAAAPLPTQLQIIGTGRQDKLRIPLSDWLFIQSEDNYIIVHSSNGGQVARHILRCTLREAEQQLGALVLRCHRSTLVNPQKIVQLSGNVTNAKVTLDGYPHSIPVARQFVTALREQHAID